MRSLYALAETLSLHMRSESSGHLWIHTVLSGRTISAATTPPDTSFDLREAIERSLQHLPELQRAILQLRDVEGYSYREIGETLSLSDSQVQVYLFRARVTMRKQLKQMGYDNN